MQIQFVFLQQTAVRRKIAEAEQEQRTGSGRAMYVGVDDENTLNVNVASRHLVGNSLLHWQPVERPEKWFSVGSTSSLTDDSGQVVLSQLQDVEGGGRMLHTTVWARSSDSKLRT